METEQRDRVDPMGADEHLLRIPGLAQYISKLREFFPFLDEESIRRVVGLPPVHRTDQIETRKDTRE